MTSSTELRHRNMPAISGFSSYSLAFVVAASLAAFDAAAGPQLFTSIEPFLGARYGMGYDMSAQSASQAGQSCVDFDPNKLDVQADGGAKSERVAITSSSELVKKMNMTAEAQLKALSLGSFEASSKLELANKSEVHQFSETKFYYNYRLNDTTLLLTEHVSIKPEYQGLLKKGIAGLDEFRAKCGNAFVIGMQTGEHYFGTSYKSIETTSSLAQLNLYADYSFRGQVDSSGYVKYAKEVQERKKKEEERVKHSTSNQKLTAPQTVQELEKQWAEFIATGSGAKAVRIVIAPYTVARGALPDGVLAGNMEEAKLKILLEALWDLKSLREAAQFVLKFPDRFAMGYPGGAKRTSRLQHVRKLHQQWQEEFDRLLVETKSCIKSFTDPCAKLANEYESNPRNSQTSLLPGEYGSQCYGKVEVRHNSLDSLQMEHAAGDTEMGGGPVLVRSWLKIYPTGRSLLDGEFFVELTEDKKDRSRFFATKKFPIFDLQTPFKELANPLEECLLASRPITATPVRDRDVFGMVDWRSRQDPRKERLEGQGLLRSMVCQLDTTGDDRNKLNCGDLTINSVTVSLVNRLDVAAENWNPTTPTRVWRHELRFDAKK